MKTRIKVLMVGVALLATIEAQATDLPDFPFLVSTGQAHREVAPDIATVNIRLLAFDKDAGASVEALSLAFESTLEILNKYEVPIESTQATDLRRSITRARNSDYQDLEILGYQVSRLIIVELDSLNSYPSLAEELAAVPNLSSLDSSFDVAAREQIEDELLVEASTDAMRKAQQMAQAFGQEIDSIYAISQASNFGSFFATFGAQDYSIYPSLSDSSPRQSAMRMFVPESIGIHQSINAVMRIDEK